jgi:hypothetical protein
MHHADCTLQQPCREAPVNQAQPSRRSVPLPSHISTDALLRIGRNAAETIMAGYEYRIFVKALYSSMFSDLGVLNNSRHLRHALYASWFRVVAVEVSLCPR